MSIHEGHRKSTKEEFLKHPESFSDLKVLELLLYFVNPRGDTNPLAHELLNRFGSFAGVMDAVPEELIKVSGIGEHAVTLLKLVKEANRHYLASRIGQETITSVQDIRDVLAPYFFGAREEIAMLLCMDARGMNLGVRQIAVGTVDEVEFYTRKVAEVALSLNAAKVIIAHNHPSGIPLASDQDKIITRSLYRTMKALGISLVDHVIFTDRTMISLRETQFCFQG